MEFSFFSAAPIAPISVHFPPAGCPFISVLFPTFPGPLQKQLLLLLLPQFHCCPLFCGLGGTFFPLLLLILLIQQRKEREGEGGRAAPNGMCVFSAWRGGCHWAGLPSAIPPPPVLLECLRRYKFGCPSPIGSSQNPHSTHTSSRPITESANTPSKNLSNPKTTTTITNLIHTYNKYSITSVILVQK